MRMICKRSVKATKASQKRTSPSTRPSSAYAFANSVNCPFTSSTHGFEGSTDITPFEVVPMCAERIICATIDIMPKKSIMFQPSVA